MSCVGRVSCGELLTQFVEGNLLGFRILSWQSESSRSRRSTSAQVPMMKRWEFSMIGESAVRSSESKTEFPFQLPCRREVT